MSVRQAGEWGTISQDGQPDYRGHCKNSSDPAWRRRHWIKQRSWLDPEELENQLEICSLMSTFPTRPAVICPHTYNTHKCLLNLNVSGARGFVQWLNSTYCSGRGPGLSSNTHISMRLQPLKLQFHEICHLLLTSGNTMVTRSAQSYVQVKPSSKGETIKLS